MSAVGRHVLSCRKRSRCKDTNYLRKNGAERAVKSTKARRGGRRRCLPPSGGRPLTGVAGLFERVEALGLQGNFGLAVAGDHCAALVGVADVADDVYVAQGGHTVLLVQGHGEK